VKSLAASNQLGKESLQIRLGYYLLLDYQGYDSKRELKKLYELVSLF